MFLEIFPQVGDGERHEPVSGGFDDARVDETCTVLTGIVCIDTHPGCDDAELARVGVLGHRDDEGPVNRGQVGEAGFVDRRAQPPSHTLDAGFDVVGGDLDGVGMLSPDMKSDQLNQEGVSECCSGCLRERRWRDGAAVVGDDLKER